MTEALTIEVLFCLFHAQTLEVHAWSRYFSKSPRMQASSCFLQPGLYPVAFVLRVAGLHLGTASGCGHPWAATRGSPARLHSRAGCRLLTAHPPAAGCALAVSPVHPDGSVSPIHPDSSVGEEPACSAADPGSIPVLGGSPREGKGYPLQYSGLENSYGLYSPWGCKELNTIERLSLHHAAATGIICPSVLLCPKFKVLGAPRGPDGRGVVSRRNTILIVTLQLWRLLTLMPSHILLCGVQGFSVPPSPTVLSL